MFISGYFFKMQKFNVFFYKKIKHLIVPFLGWNLFYGLVMTGLVTIGLTRMEHAELSLTSLLWDPFTYSHPFVFNGPSWFVGTLFLVQLLYYLLKKMTNDNITAITIAAVIFYLISLYMAFHGWSQWGNQAGVAIERTLYCLIYYHLGSVYRSSLEKFDRFSVNIVVLLFVLNGCILSFVTPNISNLTVTMEFPVKKYWLPFVVSCSGIWLYLQIADLLKDKIPVSSVLGYIGNHTFAIMMHHQFFFWLFNSGLLVLKILGIFPLHTFDYETYMTYIYFHISAYPPINDFLYLFVGVVGPVTCCWIYECFFQRKIETLNSLLLKYISRS